MRRAKPTFISLAAVATALVLVPSQVNAQPPDPDEPVPDDPPVEPVPNPEPIDEPPPVDVAPTVAEPEPAKGEGEAKVKPEKPAAPEEEAELPWYERFAVDAFADGYVSVNYRFPKPQKGSNLLRAYDVNNGASLHWMGLNVAYPADPAGGTINLRFGPSVALYGGLDVGTGLEYVKQAYATIRPGGDDGIFTLDFGKFDTFIGAEVADSQFNINYTRGVVNFYAQPFFHTGFRAELAPVDEFALRLLLVNGSNVSIDNNLGKNGGIQFVLKPADEVAFYLGYMVGPEQPDEFTVTCDPDTSLLDGACVPDVGAPGGDFEVEDDDANARLRHVGDIVIDINPSDRFRMLLNADLGHEEIEGATDALWAGGSLAMRVGVTDIFGIGARGEFMYDRTGFTTLTGTKTMIGTATLTGNLTPWKYFSSYLDIRYDRANEPFFKKGFDETSKSQITTTLGLIFKTQ